MPATLLKTHDGTSVEISPLATSDGPALQQFNAALSESSRNLFLPHAYDDETLTKIIARAEAGTDRTCVALVGERVIGYDWWKFEVWFRD